MRPVPDQAAVPAAVQRLRLTLVGLALTLLAFSQSSGQEAADTKLDLVVAPARFLRHALSMWDPTAASGQMQDQAYGYLFPMGPFFLLGKLAALQPWVIQRLWESALLIAAFAGIVRLARLLGVRGFWPRVGAGLAYALAPRVLMEIGVISSELLPAVALPWVLIPLVRGATQGSPRRAAAQSGVALLLAGGINAAATLAVLPVPALWLLTRTRGPRRRALLSWWVLAVALASLWWVVPLLVLGKYSPPFLDWIESSTVTTSRTSFVAVLRGVDHWQAYLGPNEWPGGWMLVAAPAAILATAAVAALGLQGLARRSTPHRLFLVTTLVLGVALVTLGHVATIGPPFADAMRHLLDGPLAAFRNVHKFDPVIRLPLAIGVGHGLARLAEVPAYATLRLYGRPTPVYSRMLVAVAVAAVAATAISPALLGRVVPQTRDLNDPRWWSQTGNWLGQHASSDGRALVVPGAAQPVYIWGEPRDDALQPYARGPWAVRDAAPLGQPGYVRLLDAIESRLANGRADATLAQLLARSGIRYLVVRNDLNTAASGATALRFIHATVDASPGFEQVAAFGPLSRFAGDADHLVDLGFTTARRAVDVYENTAWRGGPTLLSTQGTVVANGSADQLPVLVGSGAVTPKTPVVFGTEPSAVRDANAPTTSVFTDGIRRREFAFGTINKYSATMTADQKYRAVRAVHDYLPAGTNPLSVVRYFGISDVQVSSAAAAAKSGWAALDGDPNTAWVSGSIGGGTGQWLRVTLPRATVVRSIRIAFASAASAYPTRVRVTTDVGSREQDVSPAANTQDVEVRPGPTRSIRLTIVQMSAPGVVGLAGLAIPGVLPSRTLVVPGVADADVIAFATEPGRRSACLTIDGAAACEPSWAQTGEEDTALDRTFQSLGAGAYHAAVRVQLRPGPLLDNLLDAGNPVRVLASSVDSTDPRERAGAAVDGFVRTGWVAKAGDQLPSIQLSVQRRFRLSGILIRPIVGAPTAAPVQVEIAAGGRTFVRDVPLDGVITLPQTAPTSSVRISVLRSTVRTSTDSATGSRRLLPVGIGEIQLLGKNAPVGRGTRTIDVACGSGPSMDVNGAVIPLSLHAAATTALGGAPVHATLCGQTTIPVATGTNRIRLAADDLTLPASITLRREVPIGPTDAGAMQVQRWSDTRRDVRVETTTQAFLSVPENANDGWSATLHGKRLTPVMLDGWHQGWLVPEGSDGVVHLVFRPQRLVDIGLVVGLLAIVVLVLGAVLPVRRQTTSPGIVEVNPRTSRLVLGGAIGLAVVGGVAGAVAFAAVLLARGRGRWPSWLAGLPLLLAGLVEALGPYGSGRAYADNSGVQLLCLLALALLVVPLLPIASPGATVAAQQRPLEQVVGGGGSDRGGTRGVEEQQPEVTAEDRPAQVPLDDHQQR